MAQSTRLATSRLLRPGGVATMFVAVRCHVPQLLRTTGLQQEQQQQQHQRVKLEVVAVGHAIALKALVD